MKNISLPFDSTPPPIEPVAEGVIRPLWSVMIPTFNCAKYLRQTLESVLAQDPGPEQMQIEVVDDCSTKDDPEAVAREVGNGRVVFYRRPKNGGAIINFNTCIQRSCGHLVHILHGDDYVLPGFYRKIAEVAELHPNLSLYASRVFFVDEDGVIFYVAPRLPKLEAGGSSIEDFFWSTPVQFAGVVIRRHFYEKTGGFIPALIHTADREMWTRAIGIGGGWMMSEVLANYRVFAGNDTGKLARSGENLRDVERLNQLFSSRYPGFDRNKATRLVCNQAYSQALLFSEKGDVEASRANWSYWKENASISLRLRRNISRIARRILK